jgi:hypothetical protein
MGHPGLEVLEHGRLASRYRDRQRLARGRPKPHTMQVPSPQSLRWLGLNRPGSGNLVALPTHGPYPLGGRDAQGIALLPSFIGTSAHSQAPLQESPPLRERPATPKLNLTLEQRHTIREF